MDIKRNDDEIIAKLQLKEEHLFRKWMEVGEVDIYKESVTIEKTITVPIVQEQLVIEKDLHSRDSNSKDENLEIIRIP